MIKTAKNLQKSVYGKLARYAVRKTRGRVYKEPEDETRLPFQLDRDRIIHCKSFRRLDEKTQVFTASYGDHYRTRLTHTMEVAQISRDIARSFSLNEDLCEAIALAHDLGHPPFGHAGEETLNDIMRTFGLHFEHNEQSRRIVTKLEKLYPDFDGLNLTVEVLDGLIKHKSSWDRPRSPASPPHLEAQVVNLADEIAYTNHDLDDGIRSGLFAIPDVEKTSLWQKAKKRAREKYKKPMSASIERYRCISALINLMIMDLYEQTEKNRFKSVAFSNEMRADILEMRDFLVENFYFTEKVQAQLDCGRKIISGLFEIYYKKLPEKARRTDEKREVVVKDYIAGMTDGFARKEYERLVKSRK